MVTNYDVAPTSLIAGLKKRFDTAARVLTFPEWEIVRDREKPLVQADMLATVDVAIEALQGLYVHMDLKRARRGVDPVQQLNVFRERLSASKGNEISPRSFHEAMLRIFKSLGDAHTAYRLPAPHKFSIAFLPFLINAYERGDKTRGYVVSHVLPEGEKEFADKQFACGVEITTWNGMAIEDAIREATEFEEGSNIPHDFLLTLQFMTVRWLGASFGPESPWVVVGYTDASGALYECKFYWLTVHLKEDESKDGQILVPAQAVATVFEPFRSVNGQDRALHIGSASVHLSRKALFLGTPQDSGLGDALERTGRALMSKFFGYVDRDALLAFTEAQPLLRRVDGTDTYPTLLPAFLTAREHTVEDVFRKTGIDPPPGLDADMRVGYIGIRAFPPMGFAREVFTYELRRLLNVLPGDGLVLDIRDNPGGSANLAEESLQFLTPRAITPLPFRFIASPTTRKITEGGIFAEYKASIETAMGMGGRFSAGRPVTSLQHANEIGQHYFGPVVLITNAATYSAADIFAAGFEDHELGPVIGLDETTGGGGANCWFYQDDITIALGDTAKPLPRGINMQIAVRQCSRVGKQNDGVPIEEIGVQPRERYALTRDDILAQRPWGLLQHAVRALVRTGTMARYDLATSIEEDEGTRKVEVRTRNINRLDFFVNGRPSSLDVQHESAAAGSLSPNLPRGERVELEIRGYVHPNQLVARYVQVFPFLE